MAQVALVDPASPVPSDVRLASARRPATDKPSRLWTRLPALTNRGRP